MRLDCQTRSIPISEKFQEFILQFLFLLVFLLQGFSRCPFSNLQVSFPQVFSLQVFDFQVLVVQVFSLQVFFL